MPPPPLRAPSPGRRRRAQALALALAWTPSAAHAQATFYQVPTSDVTKPADVFVQQQAMVTDRLDLGVQAMVGLGWDTEVGLSLYNLDFRSVSGRIELDANHHDRRDPFGPLVLLTAQKRVYFTKVLGFSVGTQTGPNVAGTLADVHVAMRHYANVFVELGESTRCLVGGYVTNGFLVGGATFQTAPWVGCDVELVEDRLELQADWDFGLHTQGGAAIGPQVRFGKAFAVALGVRAPNPWADALWAGVLQLELKDPLTD